MGKGKSAKKNARRIVLTEESIEDSRILELEKKNDELKKEVHMLMVREAQLMNELAGAKANERIMVERVSELQNDIKVRTSALKDEIEKVGKLMRSKDEFIRNMSHELKTPLSVIALNIPLAHRMIAKGRKAEFDELMDSMTRNSMRLRDSIEDILELSRLGVATDYKKVEVDVKKMVDYAQELYGPIARKKGLGFITNVEQVSVIGDPGLLPYALSNLVSNAVKFTEKGKVAIRVSGNHSEVFIAVSDTGKGVTKEHQQRIFEKFFKADPNAPGSGLGLTIAREVIEGQGGRMEMRSAPGKGSTFTIILPKMPKKR